MSRKIPIVAYQDEERTEIGEVEIDNYEKVILTITDPDLIAQISESEAGALGIVTFDEVA